MSLKTWELEFYPVSAREVGKEDAVEHSLRKWEGLRAAQLEKHGVRVEKRSYLPNIVEDNSDISLPIYGATCALCWHYTDNDEKGEESTDCEECPLALARGGFSCDCLRLPEGEKFTPWEAWVNETDPEPMITALRLAKEWEARQRI